MKHMRCKLLSKVVCCFPNTTVLVSMNWSLLYKKNLKIIKCKCHQVTTPCHTSYSSYSDIASTLWLYFG